MSAIVIEKNYIYCYNFSRESFCVEDNLIKKNIFNKCIRRWKDEIPRKK